MLNEMKENKKLNAYNTMKIRKMNFTFVETDDHAKVTT
jgi:hypothetical protein